MTTDETWVHDYYAAWTDRDLERVLAWLDPEVALEDVPTGHVARGFDGAREFIEHAFAAVPGARYEVVSSQLQGDNFAVEWVMHPVGLRGVAVGTLRDGRVLSNRDYWNQGGAGLHPA